MNRNRIIHIVENLDNAYGGPAKSVPYLAKYLDNKEFKSQILSLRYSSSDKNDVVDQYGLNHKLFSYIKPKKIAFSPDLKAYLEQVSDNNENLIIHTHNLWNYVSYISSKVAFSNNIPIVISPRGALYPWCYNSKLRKKIAFNLYQRTALEKADCIHVTDESEAVAIRRLGIKNKLALVPNGVNLDEFNRQASREFCKKSLKLDLNNKYILYFSRIDPKKRLDLLIDSFLKLANEFPNWRVIVCGPVSDKNYYSRIQASIKRSRLDNRVTFTGILTGDERLNAFGAANLFVLPSYSENFGISIAEAMAAGLPIIVTSGTPWKIIENIAGWYIDLQQSSFDTALRQAMSSSDVELKKMGLNGRSLVSVFGWKDQSEKMKHLYKWILSKEVEPDFIIND